MWVDTVVLNPWQQIFSSAQHLFMIRKRELWKTFRDFEYAYRLKALLMLARKNRSVSSTPLIIQSIETYSSIYLTTFLGHRSNLHSKRKSRWSLPISQKPLWWVSYYQVGYPTWDEIFQTTSFSSSIFSNWKPFKVLKAVRRIVVIMSGVSTTRLRSDCVLFF